MCKQGDPCIVRKLVNIRDRNFNEEERKRYSLSLTPFLHQYSKARCRLRIYDWNYGLLGNWSCDFFTSTWDRLVLNSKHSSGHLLLAPQLPCNDSIHCTSWDVNHLLEDTGQKNRVTCSRWNQQISLKKYCIVWKNCSEKLISTIRQSRLCYETFEQRWVLFGYLWFSFWQRTSQSMSDLSSLPVS